MPSIFSTQNLHTFLRRKNFLPPSRGPPGPPPGRGPRGPRGPPSRGPPSRAPPSERGAGASVVAPDAAVFVTSSAMFLLESPRGHDLLTVHNSAVQGQLRADSCGLAAFG